MWTGLPRDLQLNVIKKMDIDTRVKLGIVFKLKVPEKVKEKLANVLNQPSNDGVFVTKCLGSSSSCERLMDWGNPIVIREHTYILFHNISTITPGWCVHHIHNEGKLHAYSLEDGAWKLVYPHVIT